MSPYTDFNLNAGLGKVLVCSSIFGEYLGHLKTEKFIFLTVRSTFSLELDVDVELFVLASNVAQQDPFQTVRRGNILLNCQRDITDFKRFRRQIRGKDGVVRD